MTQLTTQELREVRDKGVIFATRHARELAQEILEWHDTGLLRDGKLRVLARRLRPLEPSQSLKIAENFATRAALELAAK